MKKYLVMILVAVLALVTAGCASETAGYEDVSVSEAETLLAEENIIVLDVRTPSEYAEGHIPDAKLLPLQELEGRLGELEKDQKYLVVCRSGNRSTQASEILSNNDFTQIYNMTGGMSKWTGDIEK